MLGPVVIVLSLGRRDAEGRRPSLDQMVPLFVVGFLALMMLRSAGAIPAVVLGPTATVATWLTIVSMAALGLGVDVRSVASAGGRVTAAVVLSLLDAGHDQRGADPVAAPGLRKGEGAYSPASFSGGPPNRRRWRAALPRW